MEFYSVVLKKKINIPDSKVRTVIRNKRRFAVGKYTAKGKTYEAWRILGMAKTTVKKKVVKKVIKRKR